MDDQTQQPDAQSVNTSDQTISDTPSVLDPSTKTDNTVMSDPNENTVMPASLPTSSRPVTIAGVDISEPITAEHVLASQGIIEVDNGDGTKSQYKIEDAKARMNELESLKSKLGNI